MVAAAVRLGFTGSSEMVICESREYEEKILVERLRHAWRCHDRGGVFQQRRLGAWNSNRRVLPLLGLKMVRGGLAHALLPHSFRTRDSGRYQRQSRLGEVTTYFILVGVMIVAVGIHAMIS